MAERPATSALRVAVAGLGSVGMRVALALDAGIEGLVLAAVSASDVHRARARVEGFIVPPRVVDFSTLADHAEIVVECLPPELFRALAEPALTRGRVLVAASVGALLVNDDLGALARTAGGRIVAPSGAVAGLDALHAAAEAGLESVVLVTRKPPPALGLPAESGARLMFDGSAREVVRLFPKNINVAATVSLAGLGPDRTMVQLWADPAVATNQHELHIRSAAGEVYVSSLNLPDSDNPKSSVVTGHSIIAALRRLVAPVMIGS